VKDIIEQMATVGYKELNEFGEFVIPGFMKIGRAQACYRSSERIEFETHGIRSKAGRQIGQSVAVEGG
jgi:hypothetical protein